ncbi:hypothetical protein BHM03_00019834 [Ensete ventricosum]|nr:hypothetical protein BHM03_00019834 [Ensete ventricosum]
MRADTSGELDHTLGGNVVWVALCLVVLLGWWDGPTNYALTGRRSPSVERRRLGGGSKSWRPSSKALGMTWTVALACFRRGIRSWRLRRTPTPPSRRTTTCQWRRRSPSMTAILQQYRSPSAESLALFPPLSVISLVEVVPDRECLDLLREAEECLWRDGGLHRTTPERREPRVVEQYPVSARGLGWNVPIQRVGPRRSRTGCAT